MFKRKISCTVLSPILSSGINQNSAEIRPPSIKGVMRFWWRALHPHIELSELRCKEAEFFGSSDQGVGRAKFSLWADEVTSFSKHKVKFFGDNAKLEPAGIDVDKKLTLRLAGYNEQIAIEALNVLKVALVLGGIGKRSRRGYGSVRIETIDDEPCLMPVTLEELADTINLVAENHYEARGDAIVAKNSLCPKPEYPFLESVRLGKEASNVETLLSRIAVVSHNNDSYFTGFAGKIDGAPKRFASPVYVSILKSKEKYRPVISSLACAFEKNVNNYINITSSDKKCPDKRNAFIKALCL